MPLMIVIGLQNRVAFTDGLMAANKLMSACPDACLQYMCLPVEIRSDRSSTRIVMSTR